MKKDTIYISDNEITARVFGCFDENVRMVEKAFDITISTSPSENGDAVVVCGNDDEAVKMAATVIEFLKQMAEYEETISEQSVRYVIDSVKSGNEAELSDFGDDCICVTTKGRPIKAKTVGQKRANIETLISQGYICRVKADSSVAAGEVEIRKDE